MNQYFDSSKFNGKSFNFDSNFGSVKIVKTPTIFNEMLFVKHLLNDIHLFNVFY